MLTYKLKIINCSDTGLILQMQKDYSFAFRKLWSNLDDFKGNADFISELRRQYHLDSWQFDSLKTEVQAKISQQETSKKNLIVKKVSIEEELAEIKDKKDHESRKRKYKLRKKLAKTIKVLSSDVVFGGKNLLQRISFLSNDKEVNKDEIEKLKKEYHNALFI